MIKALGQDEEQDLQMKQTCEKDRMSDTRKALLASRAIDDMTDKITQLEEEIAGLAKEIEGLQAEFKSVEEELDAATKMRRDEHSAFLETDQDDKAAAETIKSAKAVLAKFY